MKFIAILVLLSISLTSFAQERGSGINRELILDNRTGALNSILSADEFREKNLVMILADGSRDIKSQEDLSKAFQLGSQYYKDEKFDQAYPIMSELAAWGIKDSQMILGMMYLNGQHVERSTARGMAWLGVANEVRNKQGKKAFKHVYGQLSDEHKKVIDDMVNDYKGKYGMEAQHIVCKKTKSAGTNIAKTECYKKPNSESTFHAIQ